MHANLGRSWYMLFILKSALLDVGQVWIAPFPRAFPAMPPPFLAGHTWLHSYGEGWGAGVGQFTESTMEEVILLENCSSHWHWAAALATHLPCCTSLFSYFHQTLLSLSAWMRYQNHPMILHHHHCHHHSCHQCPHQIFLLLLCLWQGFCLYLRLLSLLWLGVYGVWFSFLSCSSYSSIFFTISCNSSTTFASIALPPSWHHLQPQPVSHNLQQAGSHAQRNMTSCRASSSSQAYQTKPNISVMSSFMLRQVCLAFMVISSRCWL